MKSRDGQERTEERPSFTSKKYLFFIQKFAFICPILGRSIASLWLSQAVNILLAAGIVCLARYAD
jgi:hypothetical protein